MKKAYIDRKQIGEFYMSGNLDRYTQHINVFLLYPSVDISGRQLSGKLVIDSCLVDKNDKHEQDHFSIRMSNIGECMSLYTSILLGMREYIKLLPINKDYIFKKIAEQPYEVWKGSFDTMIKE